ncbi:YciI family protein [Frigidibacter sp. ROC022]|uniref:YciI family protein n=1 Tax=Frigidibacter sp. ROC022 TaxID=2971796 RepID=UPI00215AE3F6|nr:YciI family protein [Frigidibacter sp. ROC022]MCR8725169.1 YciI family protein [Frigidibacter sp. ROC022]
MVKWTEYEQTARGRGALALELYLVDSVPAGSPEAVKDNLPSHLEYQREMETRGALVLAGPTSDLSGDEMQGRGLIVYRAASMDEAREMASADPMHKSGAREFTLRKWLVNEGSLSLSVGLSTGRAVLS